MRKISAFTLAETIMTIGVIGVIVVMTTAALKGNVDTRTLNSQQKVFKQKLGDGFRKMQIKGALERSYGSTEAFVEVMREHFNIVKVCPKDKLTGCFDEKIRSNKNTVLYNLNNISSSEQLGVRFRKPSNIVGLVFNDGVEALITYDTDCVMPERWDTSANVTKCLVMYYDVNGGIGAGVIGQDIQILNTNNY